MELIKYVCGHIIEDHEDFIMGDYIIKDIKLEDLKCDVCKNNLVSGINIDADSQLNTLKCRKSANYSILFISLKNSWTN